MLGYSVAISPSRRHAKLLTILVLVLFLLSSVIIYISNSHFNNFSVVVSHSSRQALSGSHPKASDPYGDIVAPHHQDITKLITSLYNPFYDDNNNVHVHHSIKAYAWLSTLVYRMQDAHSATKTSYEKSYQQYIQTFPNIDFKQISFKQENNPFNQYDSFSFGRHESQQLSTIMMISNSETRPKHCIITFLGTKSRQDLMTDFNLGYSENRDIHSEFEEVADRQFKQMTARLYALDMNWSDFDVITINGHSFGAGLAVITGYLLHKSKIDINKMEIISFASPRIFKETGTGDERWREFADFVDNDKQDKVTMLRFYHELDPVPTLPPETMGYKHIAIGIQMRESIWKTGCNKGWFAKNFYCHTMTHAYLPYIHKWFG